MCYKKTAWFSGRFRRPFTRDSTHQLELVLAWRCERSGRVTQSAAGVTHLTHYLHVSRHYLHYLATYSIRMQHILHTAQTKNAEMNKIRACTKK